MRVVQVCPYSLSEHGGVQAQVFGLARALADLGHETVVVGPCDTEPPPSGGAGEVVCTGSSVRVEANGSIAPIAFDFACGRRTLRAVEDCHADVIHLHEPLVPAACLTTVIAAPAPMIGTFHLSGPSASYRLLRPLVVRWARNLSLRCAVSEDARTTAQGSLGGSYRVLFNGVDVERFSTAAAAQQGGNGDPVICFVGRHEERKGLSVLIDAFELLCGEGSVAPVLRIAGEGPQTADLRRRTRGNTRIEWLGRLSDGEIATLLAGGDVFCAPSLGGESFGIVLVEAMAAGTPVVASDISGYRAVAAFGRESEWTVGDEGGESVDGALFVMPGDVQGLARALSAVLTGPELRGRLVDAGLRRAQRFSMDTLAAIYDGIYTEVTASSAVAARHR